MKIWRNIIKVCLPENVPSTMIHLCKYLKLLFLVTVLNFETDSSNFYDFQIKLLARHARHGSDSDVEHGRKLEECQDEAFFASNKLRNAALSYRLRNEAFFTSNGLQAGSETVCRINVVISKGYFGSQPATVDRLWRFWVSPGLCSFRSIKLLFKSYIIVFFMFLTIYRKCISKLKYAISKKSNLKVSLRNVDRNLKKLLFRQKSMKFCQRLQRCNRCVTRKF